MSAHLPPAPEVPPAPAPWRTAALGALGLQVASLLWAAARTLEQGSGTGHWLDALHHLLTAVLTLWWAWLLARLTLGRGVADGEYLARVLNALGLAYPLLTALRGTLWGLLLLGILAGGASEANPVAVTGLLSIWGGSIAASFMVFRELCRWAALGPQAGAHAKAQLEDWLNVSAALTVGMLGVNLIPIAGLGEPPSPATQQLVVVSGVLDILATLLSMQAVRLTGGGSGPAADGDGPRS